MATTLRTDSTTPRAVVSRHAENIRDQFRRARSRTSLKQTDEYARNIAKKTLSSERSKAIEYVVALVVDIAQRGSLEEAEAVGLQLAAIARHEHAAAHPRSAQHPLTIAEAHVLEERAEGVAEEAEVAMAHHPDSVSHKLAYLSAAAEHTRARKQLDDAVRAATVTRA